MQGKRFATMLATCMLACTAGAAYAQKAKNTLRIGLVEPISSMILYDGPNPEVGMFSRGLFDPLLCFDNRTGKFAPNLASSWKWLDDQTLELKLHTGVKFHDGSAFDADDVIYTFGWLTDPNNGLRFAENYAPFKRAEKIDQYTVRIHTNGPAPTAMLRLAYSTPIVPSDLHGKYQNKGDFGRKTPIGTGPFKVESFTTDRIVLVRNPDYTHGTPCKPAARVARVEAVPMPDTQTQIANLATGNIDFIKVSDKAQADMLAKQPTLKMSANEGLTFQFMAIDSAGRSGNAALSNLKVRQAMAMAVNRTLVARSVTPGGDAVLVPDALCLPIHRACAYSTKPPAYDPEAARKLLAEAGYPKGFDVELTATPGSTGLAEAVAGELRKVGIRAKVDRITFAGYREKQRQGNEQVLVSLWTSGGLPDASSPVQFLFAPGARDYWHDKQIQAWMKEGMATTDEERREAIYKKAYDRVNEQAYVVPLSTKPDVFIHNRDLVLDKTSGGVYGLDFYEVHWK